MKIKDKVKKEILKLKEFAKKLKQELITLYIAYKRKETPLIAKIVALVIVSYAFSPVDLIPDFVPILGYLDDLILLPLGIKLAIYLIPKPILISCREEALQKKNISKKEGFIGAFFVLSLWILIIVFVWSKLK